MRELEDTFLGNSFLNNHTSLTNLIFNKQLRNPYSLNKEILKNKILESIQGKSKVEWMRIRRMWSEAW